MLSPPNKASANKVNSAVSWVLIERSRVCTTERLTTASYSARRYRLRFSLIRSNTTIESCTEKPITVSNAVKKRASTSQSKYCPRIAVKPTTIVASCNNAAMAHTP